MVDITIVFMGFINQLITGGHHPVSTSCFDPYSHHPNLVRRPQVQMRIQPLTAARSTCHAAETSCDLNLPWLVGFISIYVYVYIYVYQSFVNRLIIYIYINPS